MVKIDLNNDCIVIQYDSKGRLNMHSITPQSIIEYCKNNNKQDIANSIVKQEVNKYGFKYIYKFNKAVVIVGEDTNYKSEFTREFKVDILFQMTNNFSTIFEHNVTLSHCNFSKDIIFARCVFNGDLSIFDCDFRQKVNFGGSIFNSGFACAGSNFSNKVDFHNTQFENIPIFASSCFENPQMVDFVRVKIKNSIESLQIPQWQKTNILEVRDSYRAIKNILIAQNNLLDASYWHKLELYTKEIELKDENPKIFSKEWIDFWQLKFYRLTSNHHTDLLKSFNSLIILIGIFVLFGLGIVVGFNKCLGFYDSNPHAMIEFYNAHIKNAVINYKWIAFGCNAFLSLVFVGLFLFLQICNLARKIGIGLCYILTFTMLISSPKYLIPAIGIFTDRRILLDPLAINGSLYTIFFGFMIYSFIKTLRKNSIIPA